MITRTFPAWPPPSAASCRSRDGFLIHQRETCSEGAFVTEAVRLELATYIAVARDPWRPVHLRIASSLSW